MDFIQWRRQHLAYQRMKCVSVLLINRSMRERCQHLAKLMRMQYWFIAGYG